MPIVVTDLCRRCGIRWEGRDGLEFDMAFLGAWIWLCEMIPAVKYTPLFFLPYVI